MGPTGYCRVGTKLCLANHGYECRYTRSIYHIEKVNYNSICVNYSVPLYIFHYDLFMKYLESDVMGVQDKHIKLVLFHSSWGAI